MKLKPNRNLTEASKLIESMLKENTGIHFMDSGGGSGRAWQRNEKRDFAKDPQVKLDIREWTDSDGKERIDSGFSVSTYHYLCSMLALDAACKKFNKMKCENWDSELAYGLSTKGEEFLNDVGAEIGKALNTYNWDCPLDQVLQFSPLTINADEYVLLQIHGGADVRGGYTDAKLFTFKHYSNPQGFGAVDVYGTINGKNVSNMYAGGNSLTLEDDNGGTGEQVEFIGKGRDSASLWIMES